MNVAKQSRRKSSSAKKLEPIDWHEFANDAVLHGNMSTLFHRPANEDPSAYASPEALIEIERRTGRPAQNAVVIDFDTVGPGKRSIKPTVGTRPTVGILPTVEAPDLIGPTVGLEPEPPVAAPVSAPTVGPLPTVGTEPTVGLEKPGAAKPIRDVQDALTLAGQILYKIMYGAPDGARSKSCTKGYRQLAAETHLDKDTVRDLIGEFKDKGIVREIATYDPDTRSAKTYEVLSYKAILQAWRDAGFMFVTTGRKRPMFCTALGVPLPLTPTVGLNHTVGPGPTVPQAGRIRPTVGLMPTVPTEPPRITSIIQILQQITATPVDQEAADRLIADCRAEAADCTIEEIVEFAWSKAFLCRSGRIENPIGFLITQVPKHFQKEALQAYRDNKRKELETAAVLAARESERLRESEREWAEVEERQRARTELAERHRTGEGIDLKLLLQDAEADDVLKEWAKRMLKLGHCFQPRYD